MPGVDTTDAKGAASSRSTAARIDTIRLLMQGELQRLGAAYMAEIQRMELIAEENEREQRALEADLMEVRSRRRQLQKAPAAQEAVS